MRSIFTRLMLEDRVSWKEWMGKIDEIGRIYGISCRDRINKMGGMGLINDMNR